MGLARLLQTGLRVAAEPHDWHANVATPRAAEASAGDAPGKAHGGSSSRERARAQEALANGNRAEALAIIDRAARGADADMDLQFARASILFAWGRHREARDLLKRVEAQGFRGPDFYQTLGWAQFWLGELEDSERCMRLALADAPDRWDRHFGLGVVLGARTDHESARAAYLRALELKPADGYCLANLVACESKLERSDDAERHARDAVRVCPHSSVAWSNLAVVLDGRDLFDEALSAFRRAAELHEADGEAQDNFLNHAICLLRASKTPEAIALLEAHLPRVPSAQAHCHYGLALLRVGRFSEGWQQYEFRWVDGPLKQSLPRFVKPEWTGQDLAGKVILLRGEQGCGDFFQFIRYAALIKRLGATVLLEARELVQNVGRGAHGIDGELAANVPYPAFDFHVNMMSLPRVFHPDSASYTPAGAYLDVDPARRAEWERRFADDHAFRVGLAWAGSPTHMRDKYRSIRLEHLGPILDVDGVKFYSLQKGSALDQARGQLVDFGVVDLDPLLEDFTDTAAAIAGLDLVICVDTSIAHLAGALGKPVWVMLPKASDWRWGDGGEVTSWYPTMKLFRQAKADDWSEVIGRIRGELGAVRAGAASAIPDAPAAAARSPMLPATAPPVPDPRFSAVVYTCMGYVQYLPEQRELALSLLLYGDYLPQHAAVLARLVKPGATVLDAGSGIGFHTMALSRMLGATGHLLAYEGDPRAQLILRQNLAANAVPNVTVMRFPLRGLPVGKSRLDANSSETGTNGSKCQASETIDDLALESLELLKIDAKCDHVSIIDGAMQTLWRLRPRVFASVTGAEPADAAVSKLRDAGYRIWEMDAPLFNPENFNRRNFDVFEGRIATALIALPEETAIDQTIDGASELT